MSTASVVTLAISIPLTGWILWCNPPWRWSERMERDSPSGYYEVTRGRSAIFLMLFVWLMTFGITVSIEELIEWLMRR